MNGAEKMLNRFTCTAKTLFSEAELLSATSSNGAATETFEIKIKFEKRRTNQIKNLKTK